MRVAATAARKAPDQVKSSSIQIGLATVLGLFRKNVLVDSIETWDLLAALIPMALNPLSINDVNLISTFATSPLQIQLAQLRLIRALLTRHENGMELDMAIIKLASDSCDQRVRAALCNLLADTSADTRFDLDSCPFESNLVETVISLTLDPIDGVRAAAMRALGFTRANPAMATSWVPPM